uniref:hypothetical protein n=1 Tax=Gelidibacter japonicus TaxID=1962232 RepID=UPI003A91F434
MIKKTIAILFIGFAFLSCKEVQKSSASITTESLNEQAQSYLSDYNELIDTLSFYHPALNEFTSKPDF